MISTSINIVKRRIRLWLKKYKGAVLIEFAFSIPLLVIILYFALDVPTAHRLSSKMYKASELFAQILINTTKNQYPQTLTLNNLKNASRIVGLVFTGVEKSMLQPFTLSTYVIAIRGRGGDSSNDFTVLWGVRIDNVLNSIDSPTTIDINTSTDVHSMINRNSTTPSGNITNLTIQKDEVKLLIETVATYNTAGNARGFNGGLYLMTIPGRLIGDTRIFGDKTAIITISSEIVTDQSPPSDPSTEESDSD
ncbi:MAG: hypothetical protein LBJ96_03870 [Holosporaceae bacterium]|jgi:Flp pilus assembly protein TadG|nr:hypothetical protein [Holosporaceae bacterium]